jgi:ABC-2 type transport system permease protein
MELVQSGRRAANEAEREGKSLLVRYYREHPEFRAGEHSQAFTAAARIFYAAHAEVTRTMQPLLARLNTQVDRQQALVNRYRFLSPTIIAQEALNDLAGTGVARFTRFRSQAMALQSAWQDLFISNIFAGKRMTSADYDRIPRFDWREEAIAEVASRVVSGLAQLMAVVFVLALIARKALLGYTPI